VRRLDNLPDRAWHGWTVMLSRNNQEQPTGISLHVGKTFYRKSVAVQVQYGGVVDIMAYCRSERHAQQLMAVLDMLILGDKSLLEHDTEETPA
jgi:hypothetical protein